MATVGIKGLTVFASEISFSLVNLAVYETASAGRPASLYCCLLSFASTAISNALRHISLVRCSLHLFRTPWRPCADGTVSLYGRQATERLELLS